MYSDCRGRLQHKGSFGFVQNAEKIVQVACLFFFSPRHPATVYLIFYRHACKNSHVVIISFLYSRYLTVNLRLKNVWDWHPYSPLPFKGFPSSAICPSRVRHGGQFYQSMRVLFSWTQLGPEHEINLRGAPYDLVKTLLELMTDVISEGSGEHVCLHNLVRVSLTNKV